MKVNVSNFVLEKHCAINTIWLNCPSSCINLFNGYQTKCVHCAFVFTPNLLHAKHVKFKHARNFANLSSRTDRWYYTPSKALQRLQTFFFCLSFMEKTRLSWVSNRQYLSDISNFHSVQYFLYSSDDSSEFIWFT